MKIGILGTGMVGNSIGTKLIELGHEVMMGSRTTDNSKAIEWVSKNGSNAHNGTFKDSAKFGDLIFNCTSGQHTLEIIKLAGIENFENKILIDISNPLDFSKGMPPTLFLFNDNSLGEEVQKLLPNTFVIKTLNIVNCDIMVNPSKSGGEPTMLVCGNNKEAKIKVIDILEKFGWKDIIDLGDITTSRGVESMLPVWLRLWGATGNSNIAFKILR